MPQSNHHQSPRTTIVVGDALSTVLISQRVPAPSQSARIDRLAERYLAIMGDRGAGPTFTNADLATIVLACEDLDLSNAKEALVVAVRVKALAPRVAELKWPCDTAGLFHRLSSLPLTELLRLIDLAERYRGREITPEAVGAFATSR